MTVVRRLALALTAISLGKSGVRPPFDGNPPIMMSCGLPCRVTAVTAKPSLLPQESLRLGGRSQADCHQALAHGDLALAVSILALPVVGVLRRFRWAAILTVIVLLECELLAVNGG